MNRAAKTRTFSLPFIRTLLSGALLLAGGCATVGPDYSAPQMQSPPAWQAPLEAGVTLETGDVYALSFWWTNLNDPVLSELVEKALQKNHDLRKAGARIREARARRGLSEAERYPSVDASGSVTRSRSSRNTGDGSTRELYSAGLDASWEIDLFGGVRRSIEAADADLEAAREDLRDTLVSLLAEVALNYIDYRTGQARLATAEESLKTQEETYHLTRWRWQAGLTDEMNLHQSRYNVESIRSQIPPLRRAISESRNRIAVLLGETPGALPPSLEKTCPIPVPSLEVVIGTPADVLRQRPDVRRAERRLAAQTARIGVATAELYPKIRLSGAIGLSALSSSDLISSDGLTTSGSSLISWRVFDTGSIRRNIEVQSALQEQYLIDYESSILTALEEAENAIAAYAQDHLRKQSLQKAVDAAESASEMALIKYQGGLTDFGTVLEAERSLLSFRDQLAQSDGAIVTNLVKLYKAMGGGWTILAPAETTPTAKDTPS